MELSIAELTSYLRKWKESLFSFIYVCVHECTRVIYSCVHSCVFLCACVCIHVHACVCVVYVCVHMCTCACSHVCICSHVYVHVSAYMRRPDVKYMLLPLSILIVETGFLSETGVH